MGNNKELEKVIEILIGGKESKATKEKFVMNNIKILNNTYYKESSEEVLEEEILTVWQDVFAHYDISILDSFYELGGDSIKAIQIVSQLKSKGIKITSQDLFKFLTIRELAKRIRTERESSVLDASCILDKIDLTEFEKNCRDRLFREKLERVVDCI